MYFRLEDEGEAVWLEGLHPVEVMWLRQLPEVARGSAAAWLREPGEEPEDWREFVRPDVLRVQDEALVRVEGQLEALEEAASEAAEGGDEATRGNQVEEGRESWPGARLRLELGWLDEWALVVNRARLGLAAARSGARREWLRLMRALSRGVELSAEDETLLLREGQAMFFGELMDGLVRTLAWRDFGEEEDPLGEELSQSGYLEEAERGDAADEAEDGDSQEDGAASDGRD